MEGVSSVEFHGQTPFEWVITFDADRAGELGISAGEIRRAIGDYYGEEIVGLTQQGGQAYGVRLRKVEPITRRFLPKIRITHPLKNNMAQRACIDPHTQAFPVIISVRLTRPLFFPG